MSKSTIAKELTASKRKPKPRGFATMDPQRVREIASMGGKAAHEQGTAHQWTSDEARAAGRKGGTASAASRRWDGPVRVSQ